MFISLINRELLYTFKLLLLKVFAKMVKIIILLNYIKKSPFHVELTFDFSTKKKKRYFRTRKIIFLVFSSHFVTKFQTLHGGYYSIFDTLYTCD